MPSIKISIPEPCTQNWTSMTPSEKGRYCTSCEKEVIDFRNWTNEQLQDWFLNGKGRVCGNVLPKQLDYFKSEEAIRSTWGFRSKVLLASCLTIFASSKLYANATPKNGSAIHENKNVNKSKLHEATKPSDSLITITGRITAKEDKLPLPGVIVHLKGGAKSYSTDAEGRFNFQIKSDSKQKVVLEFKCLGYQTKEVEVIPDSNKQDLELEMVYDEKNMTLGVMVVSIKRPFFNRIWRFIKSPFVSRH